jgi:UDP:flavonoid glycosyltransferase YjiC (YdhE family)
VRILFSTFAETGHVLPSVPLAAALRAVGHDVAWVTEKRAHGGLAQHGIEAFGAGLSRAQLGDRMAALRPDLFDLPPRESPDVMFPLIFADVAAPALLPELEAIAEAWQPDVLVHDPAEMAAPIVAAARGIPKVTVGYGAPTPDGRLRAAAERVAPLWRSRGLEPRPWAGTRDPTVIDVFPRSLLPREAAVATTALMRTTPEERPGADAPLPAGDGPIIYVTFGTAYNVKCAETLGDAARAITALGLRCIVTVGKNGDPDALSDLPNTAMVKRFIPQADVLDHVAAVVCQAGSGTMLGALAFGVPVVALPQGADQFVNAEVLAAAGAGVFLEPEVATSDAIGRAVRMLLDDARYREVAGRIRDEIATMPTPTEIAASFTSLITTHRT